MERPEHGSPGGSFAKMRFNPGIVLSLPLFAFRMIVERRVAQTARMASGPLRVITDPVGTFRAIWILARMLIALMRLTD